MCKSRQQFGCLVWGHSGGENVNAMLQERVEDLLQGRDGFSLRINDFGKSTAASAIQVELRVAYVGDPAVADLSAEILDQDRPPEGGLPVVQSRSYSYFYPNGYRWW